MTSEKFSPLIHGATEAYRDDENHQWIHAVILQTMQRCNTRQRCKQFSEFTSSLSKTSARPKSLYPRKDKFTGHNILPPPDKPLFVGSFIATGASWRKECWKFFLPSLKLARQDPPRDITTSKKNEKHDFTFPWCGIRWIKPRVLSLITGRQRPTRIYNLSANPSIPPRLVSTSSLLYSNQIGNIHWLVTHINNEIASTRFYLYKEL